MAEPYHALIHNAVNGSRWLIEQIATRYDLTTDVGRDCLKEEGFRAASDIWRHHATDVQVVLDRLSDLTGTIPLLLGEEWDVHKSRQAETQAKRQLEQTLRKSQELLAKGDLQEASALLKDFLSEARRGDRASLQILPYSLDDLLRDLQTTPLAKRTGYPKLDESVVLEPCALSVIGGGTSAGKTTFELNLCLNMVRNYPEDVFVFWSGEESRWQVAIKIIRMLAQVTDSASLENYLRNTKSPNAAIEQAKQTFKELTESERLLLLDERVSVDELLLAVEQLQKTHSLGALFVDYLQKLPSGGSRKDFGSRQLELQFICQRLLDGAKRLKVPLITGAQFGRDAQHPPTLEDLRESGDIERDAGIVLGIWLPENVGTGRQKQRGRGKKYPPPASANPSANLMLRVLKQRNGVRDIDIPFVCERRYGSITEPAEAAPGGF